MTSRSIVVFWKILRYINELDLENHSFIENEFIENVHWEQTIYPYLWICGFKNP